jgi:glucose dehydrogenase
MGLRSRSIFAGVLLAAFAMVVASSAQANDSVVTAVSDPNGWAVAGHDYGNTRFSPLEQITSENVGKLQSAIRSSCVQGGLEPIDPDHSRHLGT